MFLRALMVAGGVALMLASAGCSKARHGPPGSVGANAAERQATDLRLNAEAFRITAAADFLDALRIYGTPQVNQAFAGMAGDMWPTTSGAEGWALFLSTALVNVAHADQPVATVGFYHPWSDVMLVTTWTKGQDGRRRIASADVLLGSVVRGARAPYPTTREWLTTSDFAPEAVGKLTAATAKAFEAGFGGKGPSPLDRLDPAARAAMPIAASMPLAEFRSALLPLFATGAEGDAGALRIWRRVHGEVAGGRISETGEAATTIAALRKLDPNVRGSFAPTAYVASDRATLVILASRINPNLFLALQIARDGAGGQLRRLNLLSFQSFYAASGQGARP